jgi:tetratricopeptide (TPR) repeat protein
MTTRLGWAQHIAAGLIALHAPDPTFLRPWSIVHRDLKPENVLLDDAGLLQITDFGIAHALDSAAFQDATATPGDDGPEDTHGQRSRLLQTAEGHIIGTPAYMAPELWHTPRSAGTAVDIYAFGVMLYELFVQQHPLVEPDESAEALRGTWAHLHTQRTPRSLREIEADLPPALETLANTCLAKAPEQRPTAAEALAQLQSIAVPLGEPAYTPSVVPERTPQHEAERLIRAAVAHGSLSLPDMERAYSEQAIARCPEQASYRAIYASTLRKLGKSEEALAEIERALTYVATEHDRLNTSREHAQLLRHFGRFAEAEQTYAMLVELQPANADYWMQRCQVQIHWAHSEWEHGRNEQAYAHLGLALDAIKRARGLAPQEHQYYNLLVALYLELTEWGKGEPWSLVRFIPSKTGGVPAIQVDGRRRPQAEANQTTQ